MDDSELDFVDLCSKLLKRVRKKVDEPSRQKKPEQQSSSQSVQEDKRRRRRNDKQDSDSGRTCSASQPVCAKVELDVACGRTGCGSGDPESPVSHTDGMLADKDLTAKDKVLLRMQHFKRASPQKMVHTNAQPQKQESDETLALRLQQQLDREAAEAQTVDLEDGGLFFCQICHRDLSHMTPEGRTQHLNRCLDESEESGPSLPPPSSVPDCPICGKKFKSQKSRSAHLKRCSSDMGVSPAVLLHALQKQAEENQGSATANALVQTGVNKRKGSSKSTVPARKKPRKKAEPLDEETMVALALSSSMVEQEKQQQREKEGERCLQMENAVPHSSMTLWRPNAGKGRGKKKKVAVPRPPPLLLVQDAETALSRLQERVSAFLLRSRAPSPATPTRCPSTLPAWTGTAPLWQKSALLDGDSTCLSDFYTAELKRFFSSCDSAKTDVAPSNANKQPDSSVQPVNEGTPASGPRTSILPACSQTASCSSAPSTPGTGQFPVGSQALRDLMELAEDGMTLTQYGYTAKENHLSGFIQEESEDQAELCVSGFVVETTHTPSDDTCGHAERAAAQPGAEEERNAHKSGALSRLASDLSSMVNNPQMSDIQLQVDSGEVYFAHSFMVYARCPLLAEMVHESGIGVQEEDMPSGQRVLLSDVPGQAVFSLLQYLYTSHCPIPTALQPHMLELASRFDLQELEQLCQLQQEKSAPEGDEALDTNFNNQTDQAFMELLRSMWNEDDDDVMDSDGGEEGELEKESDDVTSDDRETHEEQVNEEELEEIYEFAATQRKKEDKDTEEEEEEEEEQDGDAVFTKLIEKGGICDKSLHPDMLPEPDLSLDQSYSRLFSASWGVYEEEGHSPSASKLKTQPLQSRQHRSPLKASSVRTLLQSSASLVDDHLISPPPVTSNLPVTGMSPGQTGDQEAEAKDEDAVVKHESQPPCVCISFSPDFPLKKEEPELIVVSDSSEEMDVAVFSPCRLSDRSPSTQNYTGIKPKQNPTPSVATLEANEAGRLELSPNDPPDCSPELSWLIPSTPDQSSRSSRTSSTQTRSSMCRTQLFPKGASSSSSGFSPPESSYKSKHHNFNEPQKASDGAGTTESRVSRLKSSSSLDLKLSPKKSRNASEKSDIFAINGCQSELLHRKRLTHHSLQASSKQDTPLHLQIRPYSSTPLHTELHQLPVPPAASPLRSDTDKQYSLSPKPERIRSFHPSDPPSSSSLSERQRSRRQSSSSDNTREGVKRTEARNEDEKSEVDCNYEEAKEETGEADVGESSFQQSFVAMDEPPIAFNDSWGLDACVEVNPGCFSLRLEDSRGSNPQEKSSSSKPPSDDRIQTASDHRDQTITSPPRCHNSQPSRTQTSSSPGPSTKATAEIDKGLLDSKLWDSWEEGEVEESLPLSQKVSAQLKTPAPPQKKKRRSVVPITPTPHYSDMDTPDLKNKLTRFGVRPLPKRQMILKLKQIHQYTHQLASSDSEDEVPQTKSPPRRPVSCAQVGKFKEPKAPAATSPAKDKREDGELPSTSQGSNSSSTTASEESQRSNPELVLSSDGDSDSDGGVSSSQVASRLRDRLQAVRAFILSNAELYNQILQYQPLVLSQFQAQLKAAGIRLGAAKLVDYLDSQCITFTTAKPGQPKANRGRRGKGAARGAHGAGRKKKRSFKTLTEKHQKPSGGN